MCSSCKGLAQKGKEEGDRIVASRLMFVAGFHLPLSVSYLLIFPVLPLLPTRYVAVGAILLSSADQVASLVDDMKNGDVLLLENGDNIVRYAIIHARRFESSRHVSLFSQNAVSLEY